MEKELTTCEELHRWWDD